MAAGITLRDSFGDPARGDEHGAEESPRDERPDVGHDHAA
jgi:hypothetical protein